jgi:N-acetylmuramoyl-L-alanine amidase
MFTIKKLNVNSVLAVAYIIVLIFGIVSSYYDEDSYVDVFSMIGSNRIVVLDAGHGGWDPGKVADNKALEKDINLSIALKLQQYLEQGDFYVIMTRTKDDALGDRKVADMAERKDIADTSAADVLVSIHQNSYPSEAARGPQIFYFNSANESKRLAELIQFEMSDFLGIAKNRTAKPNDNYYILKKPLLPSVIVECGFLSNSEEEDLLTDDEYQDKVAWAIYRGIVRYFETES